MKPTGYIVFHLNLAFSSIEEESRPDVIRKCYYPLLDLIEMGSVPIGIELTGWTLEQIKQIDANWVNRFKALLDSGSCELIGSGYCQIIGPLVPWSVNFQNQKIGIDTYNRILDCKPNIALVNEMAFSNSMVDLYNQVGYKGIIMDYNNIKLALNSGEIPTHVSGAENSTIPVLWSDSILFQKVQHFVHGDISSNDYLDYIESHAINNSIVSIYCNDAEVFDYRPGRFNEERLIHPDGEWNRVNSLLRLITSKTEIKIVLPTRALQASLKRGRLVAKIVNAAYPVPVKKQAKYNIARWAVTGRDDLYLNTMCYRIAGQLTASQDSDQNDWKSLCELWASDLRTHITRRRWDKAKTQLNALICKYSINHDFGKIYNKQPSFVSLNDAIGQHDSLSISVKDEILLCISTKHLELQLNLRRGLAIKKLAFASHGMQACIGTLPHGFFQCISLGADYYSANTIIETPLLRSRVTDLNNVNPKFLIESNGNIEIYVEIDTELGKIVKQIKLSSQEERVSLSYDLKKCNKVFGSARIGIITLLGQFSDEGTKLLCANGGENNETFNICGQFDHSQPASTLVSSSRGLGATTGQIQIINNGKSINLQWNPEQCAVMPMISNNFNNGKSLSRVFFSMQELDDTLKEASYLNQIFTLNVSP